MKITVMPDGSAYEVKLLSGSGYKSLDQAAITAAKQGSYKSGLWHDLQASVTSKIASIRTSGELPDAVLK